MNKKCVDRWIGVMSAVVVGAIYLLTLCRGAFPGVSASLITIQTGLTPSLSPVNPIYSLLAKGLTAVSGSNAVMMLNLLSALSATLAVYLLYSLMRRGIYFFTEEYLVSEDRRRFVSILGGLVSMIFLAFSIPFWIVATRAHNAAFDLLLLLVLARLLVGYAGGSRIPVLLSLALLYGLSMAQFATLIIFLPVFAATVLYVMWQREMLRGWLPWAVVALFLAGVVTTYGLAALAFHDSPGYVIRGYRSFFQILWHSWRDQYLLISRSLPREGWLIILFVTVAPWLAMFASARRALNDDRDWGANILHLLMTSLVGAVVLNARPAPWAMLGWQRLLVTPYALVAMVAGYLAAFWFLMPGTRPPDGWGIGWVKLITGRLILVLLLGMGIWAAWQNTEAIDTRGVRTVHALAEMIVDDLEGRTWLVTDGRLDSHLLLTARDKDIPLRLLNLSAGGSSIYLDYVSTLFEDVRLQNLASLSLAALFREWIAPGSGIQEKIAVLSYPDFWPRYGFLSLPHPLLFMGADTVTGESVAQLVQRHADFQKRFKDWIQLAEADGAIGKSWALWARGHVGLAANNLGVLMEDKGLSAEAFQAYQTSRLLDPQNVSAILNMAAMVQGGRAEDIDGSIERSIQAMEEGLGQKYHIWSLSRHYGTVRMPEAFAQLGWTWAYSGSTGMAVSQIEKAADLMPEEHRGNIEGILADLYLMDNRPLESETLYKSILEQNPGSLPALLGLMRIALLQRLYERAEAYRLQALENGLNPEQAVFLQAMIEVSSGHPDPARERLETLLQEHRRLLPGWVLLAEIGLKTDDERLIDLALRRIEAIEGNNGFHGSILKGRLAYDQKRFGDAAGHFDEALSRRPGQRVILEWLLRLDLLLGRADSVRRHVRALLQEDTGHALALYVRGSLQIADGEYILAENSLRESLQRTRSPMALNDLAWLLADRGNYDEAEALVNEALALTEQHPAAWDTKGVILLRTGRTEEAEAAFGRAVAISPNNSTLHLHMGEAQLALGKIEAVNEIVDLILPFRDQLKPSDRELFNRLREGVR